jgi:hypothetical protein
MNFSCAGMAKLLGTLMELYFLYLKIGNSRIILRKFHSLFYTICAFS